MKLLTKRLSNNHVFLRITHNLTDETAIKIKKVSSSATETHRNYISVLLLLIVLCQKQGKGLTMMMTRMFVLSTTTVLCNVYSLKYTGRRPRKTTLRLIMFAVLLFQVTAADFVNDHQIYLFI